MRRDPEETGSRSRQCPDSLGDGAGGPTADQIRLYERWAKGGLALSIIGEVQGSPHFAEKPGNLVLNNLSDRARFERLAKAGGAEGALLWPQLGARWSDGRCPDQHAKRAKRA